MKNKETIENKKVEPKVFKIEESVEDSIQEMLKDKQENPDLIIPYSFLEFYNRPEMIELLGTVYEYCKTLVSNSHTYANLKKEGKNAEAVFFSNKSTSFLSDLGKIIAKNYGQLILRQKGVISSSEEQNFYETVIYFIIKVIRSSLPPEEGNRIDEELNRLFRGTAFNIFSRKKNLEIYKKLPILKPSHKRDSETVINNLIYRTNLNKKQIKSHSHDGTSHSGFVKTSAYKAINSRSPLISLLLPSPRDKIRQFEQIRRKHMLQKLQKLPEISRSSRSFI